MRWWDIEIMVFSSSLVAWKLLLRRRLTIEDEVSFIAWSWPCGRVPQWKKVKATESFQYPLWICMWIGADVNKWCHMSRTITYAWCWLVCAKASWLDANVVGLHLASFTLTTIAMSRNRMLAATIVPVLELWPELITMNRLLFPLQ